MGRFVDISGQRFGRLVALERIEDKICGNRKIPQYLCKCDCGNYKKVRNDVLKNGYVQSCGCLGKEIRIKNNQKYKKKYNQYDLSGEYGIGLTRNTNQPFYFDKEDYELIKDYCWSTTSEGYIACNVLQDNKKYKTIMLHKLLLPDYMIIDHINHDKFDNRKSNLRNVTNQQNCYNQQLSIRNTSGVTGVQWYKPYSKWVARIKINGKTIHLGYYTNFDEAVKARKKAEEKYFGEYSYDNSMKQSQTI